MKVNEIKTVSCVGAGIIGYSWALYFSLKGLNVTLYDVTEEALSLAKKRINESLKTLVDNKVIENSKVEEIESRIISTTNIETAVKNAQFIVESAPESYEIKKNLITEIEKYTSESTIIASSTSGLLITKIAEDAAHPDRFIGAHPYNPPHLIPLVEITKGEKTSTQIVNTAKEFYKSIGKEPVVLEKEALGFICNRIQMALYREVCDLVMRGVCTIEDADKAVTFGPGLRWGIMGPSLVFELAGGSYGIKGALAHMGPSANMWLSDMADFKKIPEEFADIAQDGVNKELEGRKKEIGNTPESLEAYRDKMLIEMLKLHEKL